MKGSNRPMTEKCKNCDEYSNGRADAEEEIKEKLKESFPLSAPFKRDPMAFAESYIAVMRKWATENLDIEPYNIEDEMQYKNTEKVKG